jgi:hypothetical protein
MLPASITERVIDKMISGMSYENAIKFAFQEEENLILWLLQSKDAKPVKEAIAHSVWVQINTNEFNKKYSS